MENKHKQKSGKMEENIENNRQTDEEKKDTATKESNRKSKDDSNAATESSISEELERIRDENEQLRDKLLRTAAEFDNFRKRQEKILANMIEQERNNVIGILLDVSNDVDRALQQVESGGDPQAIYEGIQLVAKRIRELLKLEGVQIDDPTGKIFDPLLHEAVGIQPVQSEQEDNVVLETIQPCYKRNGKLIFPAKVIVGKHTPEQKQIQEDNQTKKQEE
ncbi:nucleotide exchange factor GrpE [bacterium]|nr:MAG: nucleotide exchange factor GrpE [bacterium]